MAARARGTSLVLAAVGCLATQLQVASSTVTVLAPLNATGLRPNTKIPSSTYVYFGPRPGYELSAPGVFLSNREACAPNPVTVKGKVVVTRNTLADCLIEDIYDSLGNYGAAAYVVLVGNLPISEIARFIRARASLSPPFLILMFERCVHQIFGTYSYLCNVWVYTCCFD